MVLHTIGIRISSFMNSVGKLICGHNFVINNKINKIRMSHLKLTVTNTLLKE